MGLNKEKNYTIYHLHDDRSNTILIDSTSKQEQYIEKAKGLNMNALAFSNHGNVFNWVESKQKVEKAGMKYIFGVEAYMTMTLSEKIRDSYHVGLYAKNYDGVLEINKLISNSFNKEDNHFYYRPRISYDELLATSKNVIITTACLGNFLWKWEKDNNLYQQQDFLRFAKNNKDRVYLEVQYHNNDDQKEFNKLLLEWAYEYDLNIIAGTDTHNVDKYASECRTILQKAKGIEFSNEDSFNLDFKTYDELYEAFLIQGVLSTDEIERAMENTNVMADSVEEFELDYLFKYPQLYDDPNKEFKDRVVKSFNEKISNGILDVNNRDEYIDRIKEEFSAYKKLGAGSYMIFVADIYIWAKQQGIELGTRGSVTGSFLAFLLGITEIDAVKYGTVFSRFFNVDRVSLPDIDMDVPMNDRASIYEYIRETMGSKKTSKILSFGTTKDKSAIDEIARALNINVNDGKKIKKMFDDNGEDAVRSAYPEVMYYFNGIRDTITSKGEHPCGMIASPITLNDNMGLIKNADGEDVSSCDMGIIDGLNYVKIDVLGLKNMSILQDVYKLTNIKPLRTYEMNFDDEEIWDDIKDFPVGIFQMESKFAHESLNKMDVRSLDDMTAVNAGIRPSGTSYRDDLFKRKFHKNPSKEIDKLLEKSMGYCVSSDTIIQTKNGYKKIKDLDINGDIIINKDGEFKINHLFNNGIKKVSKLITVGNYEIECTKEHKILTQDGYKKLEDLEKDDVVGIYVGSKNTNTYDESKLKIIAYLIGDGDIMTGNNTVMLYNKDIDVIKSFKTAVEKTYKSLIVNYTNVKSRVNKLDLYKASVSWRKHSKKLKPINEYMIELGLNNKKSREKSIPEFIYKLKREDIIKFLAYYFDTDACYYTVIRYKTASKKIAKGLQELFRLCGYVSNVTENNEYSYDITINDSHDIVNEFAPYSFKINKSNVTEKKRYSAKNVLPTKTVKKIFDKFLNNLDIPIRHFFNSNDRNLVYTYKNHKYTGIDRLLACKVIDTNSKYVHDNIVWTLIKSIEIDYKYDNVYDIEVDNMHNYVANGFIVHNCLYQEDTIKFLQQMCGFSGSESDTIRRYIGKKKIDKINESLPKIIDGYCNNTGKNKPRDIAEEEANQFIQIIKDSGEYQFNYNHAFAYSVLGYKCGYLRYHYPIEFVTALLNNAKDESDYIDGEKLAKHKGIKIEPIRYGFSTGDYNPNKETNTIYKGLASIKFLQEKIANELLTLSKSKFDTFTELLIAITETTSVNSRQLMILIKLNFFIMFGEIGKLLDIYNNFTDGKYKYKKTYVDSTKQKRVTELIKYENEIGSKFNVFDTTERILFELSVLGKPMTIDSDYPRTRYVVMEIDTKYSPRLKLYRIRDGVIINVKIYKKVYKKNRNIKVNDILMVKRSTKRYPRVMNGNGEFVVDKGRKKENIIEEYSVTRID